MSASIGEIGICLRLLVKGVKETADIKILKKTMKYIKELLLLLSIPFLLVQAKIEHSKIQIENNKSQSERAE